MNKLESFLIQLHVALALLGYPFIQASVTLIMGESTRLVSISYDAFQLVLSFFVMLLCYKDLLIEKGNTFLSIYSILLILYSLRMLFDATIGPFANQLSLSVFFNDIIFTVGHAFTAIWAIIVSRKYLNINRIINMVFWLGLITLVMVVVTIRLRGIGDMYEEERLQAGRGLHSLMLVKVGAIEVLAAFHLLFQDKKKRLLYIIGLVFGLWMTFASGSRGGVAGLVIAMEFYWVVSSRKKWYLVLLAITVVVLFLIYLVPILTWLSNFFPVLGNRMLLTILEGDQSGRAELRAQAIDLILEHPVFGFGYRMNTDITGYGSHNGILDQFLCLGIPLGIIYFYFVYIKGLLFASKLMIYRQFIFPASFAVFVIVSSMSSTSTDAMFGVAMVLLGVSYYYGGRMPVTTQRNIENQH